MLSREERLTKFMPPAVVEMLERRRLMTISCELNGTTLEITGGSGADYASVSLNPGGSDDSLVVFDGSSNVGSFDDDAVNLIKFLMGGGNDSVFVDNSGAGEIAEVCLVYGEGGNDSVDAGNLADSIFGGDGDDVLRGVGGNDSIYGGAGYDTLDGGVGDDTVRGEGDADSIVGGFGSDFLHGGDGADTLIANDGEWPDILDGGAGTDCANIDNADTDVINVEGFF